MQERRYDVVEPGTMPSSLNEEQCQIEVHMSDLTENE